MLFGHRRQQSHLCATSLESRATATTTKIIAIARPWLTAHPARPTNSALTQTGSQITRSLSDGENDMVLWILNVWIRTTPKSKKWNMDLFGALGSSTARTASNLCLAR